MSWLIWANGGKIDMSHDEKEVSLLLSIDLPNGENPITSITLTKQQTKVLINSLRRCYKELVKRDLAEIGEGL